MPPVKLYVGPHYKEEKLFTHVELLFPFWGVAAKESMPYVRTAALQYQYSKDDFTLVEDIKDCDYVLMPYSYDRFKAVNPEKVEMIVREAREAGKTLLIDGAGDIENPIDIPNTLVFRVSSYRYAVRKNEISVPYSAEDLAESFNGGSITLREKGTIPSIGFTGWASQTLIARTKLFIKELPTTLAALVDSKRGAEHKGLLFRARALRALARTKGIAPNFQARTTYSGHVKTISGNVQSHREEFVQNLRESDYALAVRGDANASVRFYEALSMGKIPVFLDTACVLPLEDRIKYEEFCLFVDWRDTDRIGDMLREFHSRLTPEHFRLMQEKARAAYKNYLRMDAFSKQLADVLRSRLTLAAAPSA